MPGTTHKDKLIKHLDRIESVRKDLFSDLDSLTGEQLRFKKASEKWNILQILDHVMTSEKLSVVYIRRKTSNPETIERSGFRSFFRVTLLKLAFILPFKYKAPKISDSTGKDPEFEKLKSDWRKIREDLREQVKRLDENILKGEILRHPIVGMLNMKQALEFFEIHFNHHKKQIDDLMKHLQLPRSE